MTDFIAPEFPEGGSGYRHSDRTPHIKDRVSQINEMDVRYTMCVL